VYVYSAQLEEGEKITQSMVDIKNDSNSPPGLDHKTSFFFETMVHPSSFHNYIIQRNPRPFLSL
jgi:hypothetical protein